MIDQVERICFVCSNKGVQYLEGVRTVSATWTVPRMAACHLSLVSTDESLLNV